MKDKKQLKSLSELGIDAEIGFKHGLNRDIHYTLAGKDSTKDLLVFVHGSPGSSSNFLQFAKDSALLNHFQILLLDRPGFGYSNFGKSLPLIADQAIELIPVVKQFNGRRTILVGHSLGGPIICRMQMDAPELADALMIVAGSVSPELEPQEKWRKLLNFFLIRWMLPRSFVVSNQEIMPAKEELIKMEKLWPKIKSEVIIIQGGKDNLVPPGNADYAKNMLINARKVTVFRYPELNHFIPFSEPEIMVEKLLAWHNNSL